MTGCYLKETFTTAIMKISVVEYVDQILKEAVLREKFELIEFFFLEKILTDYHSIHL